MSDAASEQAALEEEARQRAEEIRATEKPPRRPRPPTPGPPPTPRSRMSIGPVTSTTTDTTAYQRPQLGCRRGPPR